MERMEASVRDYLDENGLDDMAALAKKYDVSKSSIQRYVDICIDFIFDVLLTFFHYFADTLQLEKNQGH